MRRTTTNGSADAAPAIAFAAALALAVTALPATGHAQTATQPTTQPATATGEPLNIETNMGPGREGEADAESVVITLSDQATEIRQILMEGGEMGRDGLDAAIRAREIAGQAIEATGILGNPGDTQVTTTRMSAMDQANASFERMAEALDIRIAAIRAGDATAANRARLAAIDAINELPNDIRFGGDAAMGDNPTGEPGGAQPILQQ